MGDKSKVNIFLVLFVICVGIIVIFALGRSDNNTQHTQSYDTELRELRDSIATLKNDIERYKLEINRIDLERNKIKAELNLILKDNEKIDIELTNGSLDDNIKFLTEFLSEDDNLWTGHCGGSDDTSVDSYK